ncbi:hypothetical protein SY88_03395 [Clostridiales bacterium PH28_bin88]|nr:hypothetical protein SY88_03395 [Clostridiales bacterium PH28_bin88]
MIDTKPADVLLMAFGGPDSPEAIEPFMANLMGGRPPAHALLAKVKERYRMIGGSSPLLDITRAQAGGLQEELNAGGGNFRVYAAMRYWRPFIGETLEQMAADGVQRAVAVSLSPHYSRVSTGAYAREVENSLSRLGAGLQVAFAPGWYDHPLFIQALAEKLLEALGRFPEERRGDVQVIFSAHSLPLTHIHEGDPYVDQLRATVSALVERLDLSSWHLAYQSKGGGQDEWLGPHVEEVLDGFAGSGRRDVLLAPVGFVADHVETLYDIDVAIRQHAEALGLNFRRAASLNASPTFLKALADVVRQALAAMK